jgi:hypothetical protein
LGGIRIPCFIERNPTSVEKNLPFCKGRFFVGYSSMEKPTSSQRENMDSRAFMSYPDGGHKPRISSREVLIEPPISKEKENVR